MLKGKMVVLGVSGGIAAYKSAVLARVLIKNGADVQVIMTKNAVNFINPLTFEELTKRKCLVDTFDRNVDYHVKHIAIAKEADLIIVAPATANLIAKLAHGLADDMLTTTILAAACPKIIAPAMNTGMYENPATQHNIKQLIEYGMEVVTPVAGLLACGDVGLGKMPEPEDLLWYVKRELALPHDMAGKKVLVTAGPTQEAIDPVRFITNHSSGKMGYALAQICMLRGAEVTLVSGPANLTAPPFVEVVPVVSAADMFDEVTRRSEKMDIIIKAAAVSDYTPEQVSTEKVKKAAGEMSIPLKSTSDILKYLGDHKREGQYLCGFSMETQNMLENSRDKLVRKNLDMIVANNLKETGAGFGIDTNVVTLITAEREEQLAMMSKEEVAIRITNEIQGSF